MTEPVRTRIKLCGLTNPRDAELAVGLGADAIGFVLEPSSPRYVGESATWIDALPPVPQKVAVYGPLLDAPDRNRFDLIQASTWDDLSTAEAKRILALRIRPSEIVQELLKLPVGCGAILLDAYRDGAYGGTGHTIDWTLAAEIVKQSGLPVFLAGGLTPDNVASAIHSVKPFAVDVSSGIESSPGVKDRVKMRDFVQAVRAVG